MSPVVCGMLRFIGALASDSRMALSEEFFSLLPFVADFRFHLFYQLSCALSYALRSCCFIDSLICLALMHMRIFMLNCRLITYFY